MSQELETKAEQKNVEIVKIFGGPGTGKTTTMVGNTGIEDLTGILERLFNEFGNDRLMLIAYTRSAAEEAKGRLADLTEYSKSDLKSQITTIHSLTMGMTNIYGDDIVEIRNQWDKSHFCNEIDLEYGSSNDDDDDMMDTPDDEGHLFFQMYGWLKSNMLDYDEWKQCPIASEWPSHREDDELNMPGFATLADEWDAFKSSRGIYEFDDVIELAVEKGYTIDSTELFVDEVQDLYPLQQAFLDNQMNAVDRVWLAGDDDQTIYEWAGANPDYFINIQSSVDRKAEEFWEDKSGYWDDDGTYILDQSYRMPANIMALSQTCIRQVRDRQEKEFKPHKDGGTILHYERPDPENIVSEINHDDTFILFRSNMQASNFGKKLIGQGIPFTDRFKTWRKSVLQLRDAIAALWNDDEHVDGRAAFQLVDEFPDDKLMGSGWDTPGVEFKNQSKVPTEELADCFSVSIPETKYRLKQFVEMLIEDNDNRNYYQGEAIRHNITAGNEHLQPEGVTIETIHWSKGREADTVILSLNTTGAVEENMVGAGIPDAERRLYYVGMTRAENNLVLAENLDWQSPSVRCDDLFGPSWDSFVDNMDD